jgi:hypothetical protein
LLIALLLDAMLTVLALNNELLYLILNQVCVFANRILS